jgi:Flp pilus assembly protein TadD
MRRLRRRLRFAMGQALRGGQSPILTPAYVPVPAEPASMDRPIEAPVLPLEGLEPWAEIRGPALATEETAAAELLGVTFTHPDQLELERWAPPAGTAGDDDGAARAEESSVALAEAPDLPAPEALPEPPEDPAEPLYIEARRHADEGRADEARQGYRAILSRFPRHVRARSELALLLDAAGDREGALVELDRALELDPDETRLLAGRGALLGALGRHAAAERDLRRVLRVEPAHVEALFHLGVVMTRKGLWNEAVPLLRHVTELEPDRGAAFYYLGESLNHVDDLLGALAAFQRATQLQPANARALYGLGIIYDRLARPDDAAAMYRRSRAVGRR